MSGFSVTPDVDLRQSIIDCWRFAAPWTLIYAQLGTETISSKLLKNFRILNQTCVAKILKKNEKVTGISSNIYIKRAENLHIYTSTNVEELITQTETLFIESFANGDRHSAMRKLRIPDLRAEVGIDMYSTMRLGD